MTDVLYMRPRRNGRVYERRLIVAAAERLAQERRERPVRTLEGALVAGGTARELAALAGLGLDWAQQEIDNMRRRGELVPLGHVRSPQGNRPSVVYGPGTALPAQPELPGIAMLDSLMRSWSAGASAPQAA